MIEAPDLGSRHLVTELRGRVLHLRIDRIERRNSFTQDMYRGIKRAAVWADGQPELDAVCITGTDQWFGAGGDMAGNAEDTDGLAAEWDPTEQFPFRHIDRCSKLWVAAVNGTCVAGGLDIALHCDITIASDQATFRIPELLRGIPEVFMADRLVAAVGLARARYLFFTAEPVDAHEAAAMGLVGTVVPHAELDAEVERVLATIAKTGPNARAAMKREINRRFPAHDMGLFNRHMMSPEMIEGMSAFIEKRDADWPRS